MTDNIPIKKWAGLKMNNNFLNIKTFSGYIMFMGDSDQKNTYLSIDVGNQELGKHIREALSLSRFVHPVENQDLDLYLYNPDRYKEWIDFTMKKFVYKTKSKMFKPMLYCSIELYDGMITFDSWNQRALEAWDTSGINKADNVIIPETCTDEELGAAARLALSRCTSKFIDKDD